MARPIKFNQRELRRLQSSCDEKARDQVREVAALMPGRPTDAVFDELMRRLQGIGVSPNAETVRRFAAAIEGGCLIEEGHPRRINDVILRFDEPPAPKRMGEA